MMGRLGILMAHDMRLQWRYGIYPAYMFVIFATVTMMVYLGDQMPDWLIALIVFSDYAALGYLFLGGMMMLEASEDTRTALAMTPVSGGEYLASKALTLLMIVMVMSILLAIASGRSVSWPLYLVSVLLITGFYIGLGAFLATHFKTLTGYIIGAALLFFPAFFPCWLALLDPLPAPFLALPAVSQLKLLIVALGGAPLEGVRLALMLLVAALAASFSLWLGRRALIAQFGQK